MSHQLSANLAASRAIVIQMGARRAYAVPTAFAVAGRLEALYTDLAGSSGLGRAVAQMSARLPLPQVLKNPLSRLANRTPPDEISSMTRTFDGPAIRYELAMQLARGPREQVEARLRFNQRWGRAMLARGFGNATHIYAMMSGQTLEGDLYLAEARRRGLAVVIDVTIALSAESIIAEEYAANPGWGSPPVTYLGAMGFDNPAYTRMMELGTCFLCASPFVAEDMITRWGADPARVHIEPYSVHPKWLELINSPSKGRVLFAGSADLRKGIHYFARAASALRTRGYDYHFRVVGNVDAKVRTHTETAPLDFAGRLPREAMFREFAEADIMVLPTLAEGSAGVTYEALAAGVPVVTTQASGSLVSDGVNGRIVSVRDVAMLADAIEEIVENRGRREAMAKAARDTMRGLSWQTYSERLVRVAFGVAPMDASVVPTHTTVEMHNTLYSSAELPRSKE